MRDRCGRMHELSMATHDGLEGGLGDLFLLKIDIEE